MMHTHTSLLNFTNFLLLVVLLIMALTVVYSSHTFSQKNSELRQVSLELKKLQTEHAKLQLEKVTLSSYSKIRTQAETRLQLKTPVLEQRVRVTP